ncbi:MAG TPA: DUF362 domain-containing protein [Longimicrobiales bacterium]|nr:DUF362 domain-containing protein [Longimicrobiales bacterium]
MPYGHSITRRSFIRGTAAGLVTIPAPGIWAWESTGRRRPAPSRVAIVRTRDRREGVARALKLFGPPAVDGRHAVVKPNFNTADPTPGSTHNDTLSQLMMELQERGARSITLGESSGPPNTRSVMEQKGIFDLAHDLRFGVVNFDEMPESDWVAIPAAGTHWPDGFHVPRLVAAADYLVTTCTLKTHAFGGVFTMALKLSVGLTPKPIRRSMHRSPDMRRMIADLNTAIRPKFILLDGVDAFTDGGPSTGQLARGDIMIAGDDPVAVDAVGLAVLKEIGSNAAIMDRRIFEQEQIARAAEIGLGADSPDRIQLITADPESRAYATRLERILALG